MANRPRKPRNVIEQAITAYQENVDSANQETLAMLREEFAAIWREIQKHPNSYTMDNVEFKVFSNFQGSHKDDPLAVRARQRYWEARK